MDNSEIAAIVESVQLTFIVNCSFFAVLAFLVYDTAILFDNEVEYFWKSPRKAISCLYFATRYSGIFFIILQILFNSGNATVNIQSGLYSLSISTILDNLYRLYIATSCPSPLFKWTMTIFLAIVFILDSFSGAALAIQSTVLNRVQTLNLVPGLTYCTDVNVPSPAEDAISWSIPSIYGIILMILAIYKSSKILKENPGMNTTNLIRTIVRDQLIYFVALLFVSVAAILNYFFTPPTVPGLIITESIGNSSILSSVGARLLLNMKEAGAKGLNEGMGVLVDPSSSRETVSGMDFAAPPAQLSITSSSEGGENLGRTEDKGIFEA